MFWHKTCKKYCFIRYLTFWFYKHPPQDCDHHKSLWSPLSSSSLTVCFYPVMCVSHCSQWNFKYCTCFKQSVPCTLKCIQDMIKIYSQMHHIDKHSHDSSIIWPIWLNGWVFVCKLSSCRLESSCNHHH